MIDASPKESEQQIGPSLIGLTQLIQCKGLHKKCLFRNVFFREWQILVFNVNISIGLTGNVGNW